MPKNPSDDRVSVRLGKLSSKLAKKSQSSGQKESEIVRAALDLFFAANPTSGEIIQAVIAYRAKEAAK